MVRGFAGEQGWIDRARRTSSGVEAGDPWGHRGMAHALSFALAFLFVVVASHGAIDAFIDGDLGLAAMFTRSGLHRCGVPRPRPARAPR